MHTNKYNLIALSAPHWVRRATDESMSLNSRSPFSLQNAIRLAAQRGIRGEGALGSSNWSTLEGLRESVFLMQYWEDERKDLERKLRELRPDVLFIGAMTLSFPGAIEVAKLAKEVLGDDVFIILGGKHVNETFFEKKNVGVVNTGASPLRLMHDGKVPEVFDLVCSGPSEEIIAKIAQRIGELKLEGKNPRDIYLEIGNYVKEIRGDWRVGWIENGEKHQFQGLKIPVDYREMPIPAELFGISGNFRVFDTELTAHAFSDTSPGCTFDCFFCSERKTINASIQDEDQAADRLFRQLKAIKEVALRENNTESVSVFVEDSTLLNVGMNPQQLHRLAKLMKDSGFFIKFGGQFTVDQIRDKGIQEAILALKEVGFDYIFTGMETENEKIAHAMSKNVDKGVSWVERNEQAIAFAKEAGINYGISILFGLGESQETRLTQLRQVKMWQDRYGIPSVISLNLATIHPLQKEGGEIDFSRWGTDSRSPYIGIFQRLFGEASEIYTVDRKHMPSIEELKEIAEEYLRLELSQEVRDELSELRLKLS